MTYIPLKNRFHTDGISTDLHKICQEALTLSDGGHCYFSPTSLASVAPMQSEKPQLIAGSTDLGVQINKGRNTTPPSCRLLSFLKPGTN